MKPLSTIKFDSLRLPIFFFLSYDLPGASGSISGSWSFTSGVRTFHIRRPHVSHPRSHVSHPRPHVSHPASASFTSSIHKLHIQRPQASHPASASLASGVHRVVASMLSFYSAGEFSSTARNAAASLYYYCEHLNFGQCHFKDWLLNLSTMVELFFRRPMRGGGPTNNQLFCSCSSSYFPKWQPGRASARRRVEVSCVPVNLIYWGISPHISRSLLLIYWGCTPHILRSLIFNNYDIIK